MTTFAARSNMETEELIKIVDGIYKNILDKFNPGARQMINAGKAYLKALHGAAAASRMYVDTISKLARQAQQGTWGGSSDIGVALAKIVDVYKEIQERQMNILKAFYVDLLVPLETNLEKDTKVVQSEQKRFLQQHKQRSETYSKAAAMMKKQRKKSRGSSKTGLAMDKELKNMQVLEEEKTKLDAFCEQSLKNAMTQERRRYGFVLERQCSLSKHYLSYYTHGVEAYQENIDKWSDVSKSREYLPESMENLFSNRFRQIAFWQNEDVYSNPRSPNLEEDRISINSQLRKTKSMDASCLDVRSIDEVGSPVTTLNRAKSEYNLNSSTHSVGQECTPTRRPRSIAVPPPPSWDCQLARALYAYLSSGENQLSFHEGDLIALIGERNKGWQFGENLRTQCSGWFPLAYTEILDESTVSPTHRSDTSGSSQHSTHPRFPANDKLLSSTGSGTQSGNDSVETPSTRMFGDTLHLHRSTNNAKQIRRAIGSNNIPPPNLPAPVPTPTIPQSKSAIGQSQNTILTSKTTMDTTTFPSPYSTTAVRSSASFNFSSHVPSARTDKPSAGVPLPLHLQTKGGKIGGPAGNASLHSSNDSGFSNDPPPQPEVDYSDDDSILGHTKLSSRRRILKHAEQQQNLIDNQQKRNNSIRKTQNSKSTETPASSKKLNLLSQSRSHGNLVESRLQVSNDIDAFTKERKTLVKRTKSFWKFGKSGADTEILEGMALWKHRDLVDVVSNPPSPEKKDNKVTTRKTSYEKSEDSDKTINNNQNDTITKSSINENIEDSSEINYNKNIKNKQKMYLIPRRESVEEIEYNKKPTKPNNFEDQFYDDDGDGLMLKTLNRKNILQQYNNSSGTDSEPESDMTSDDPYDSILVDDQKVKKIKNQFPNVAELGKKLEILSKSSKYSPTKENNDVRNLEQKKNLKNKGDRHHNINYHNKSFKNAGVEIQNNENGEKEMINNERYYNQGDGQGKKLHSEQEKHKSYNKSKNQGKSRGRGEQNLDHRRSESKDDGKHQLDDYDSTNDEFSDATDNKLYPQTTHSNFNSYSSQNKYYQDKDLLEYGEVLQKRRKNPEYNSKFDDKSPHNGNMYGPWYDLWGLDSTGMARKT